MGLLNSRFEKRSGIIPDFAVSLGGIGDHCATVNTKSALGLTAVWSVISRIASTMGMLPLHIFESTADGKKRRSDHPLYDMLHANPNAVETAFDWRYIMAVNQLLHGAGISRIEFDPHGVPVALHVLDTTRVAVKKLPDGKIVYEYTPERGAKQVYQPHQVLVLRMWPQPDGAWLSLVDYHRQTLSAAITAREYGVATYAHGMRPAGVISGLTKAPDEASRKSIDAFFSQYQGVAGSRKVLLLEQGTKFEAVSVKAADAQYLESRRFDISEVARIYNVPLFLLAEHEKNTSWGSGIEQMSQAFVTYVMQRYCTQWEAEINKKLVSVDNKNFYCRFALEGLLRGNTKERWEAYGAALDRGVLSQNEVRTLEDLNPIPNGLGDHYFVPLNMQSLKNAVEKNTEEGQDV